MTVLAVHAGVCSAAGAGGAQTIGQQELAIRTVGDVPNPCDVNKQRMKKVGGVALGAILGFGLCRLATEVADKDSSTSSKNKKSAACAVAGGIVGYSFAADSSRRQCELFRIAQQNQIDASFQEITVVPAAALTTDNQGRQANESEAVVAVATISGLEHFASGSAILTPAAQQYFAAMARIVAVARQGRVGRSRCLSRS